MKKICASMLIIIFIFSLNTVFATAQTNTENIIVEENEKNILEIKDDVEDEMDEYARKYGSEAYGLAAFILEKVRIYSIPLCFIGIAIGALYQFVMGTRRLDMKHKGFGLIIASVTILAICQVLPLIFTLVVIGWR